MGKVILTYILVGVHDVNIKGAALGTMLAYVVALVLNNISVRKYTGVKISYNMTYLRPCIAAAIMGVCAFAAHKILMGILHSNSIATLLAIAVGAVVYVILIFSVKAITMEELEQIPGGGKLTKILRRFVK